MLQCLKESAICSSICKREESKSLWIRFAWQEKCCLFRCEQWPLFAPVGRKVKTKFCCNLTHLGPWYINSSWALVHSIPVLFVAKTLAWALVGFNLESQHVWETPRQEQQKVQLHEELRWFWERTERWLYKLGQWWCVNIGEELPFSLCPSGWPLTPWAYPCWG